MQLQQFLPLSILSCRNLRKDHLHLLFPVGVLRDTWVRCLVVGQGEGEDRSCTGAAVTLLSLHGTSVLPWHSCRNSLKGKEQPHSINVMLRLLK